jgi:hypothetical protein
VTVVLRRRLAFVLVASSSVSLLAHASTATVEACRAIADDRQRLACYDAAIDAATRPPSAPQPASAQPTAPPSPPHVVKKAEPQPPPPDTLNALVTRVEANPLGRITVDLDNGERWSQTDTTPFVLRVGDRVNVKHARFGSYLLEVVGGGRGMRVKLEASDAPN